MAGQRLHPGLYEQYCFACGRQNPIGLQLRFDLEADGEWPDAVVARYRPRREDEGFPGVMHGGILVTLLDEAMAWAMYAHRGVLGVTARMETRYRRSVPSDVLLTVRGRVVRERGRRIEVDAVLESPAGERLVESSALFLRPPPDEERRLMASIGWETPSA